MTDEKVDINALIEKATNQETELNEIRVKVTDYESKINDLNATIQERDAQIVKLQSILSNNLIASKEKKVDTETEPMDFKTAYRNMVKENMRD